MRYIQVGRHEEKFRDSYSRNDSVATYPTNHKLNKLGEQYYDWLCVNKPLLKIRSETCKNDTIRANCLLNRSQALKSYCRISFDCFEHAESSYKIFSSLEILFKLALQRQAFYSIKKQKHINCLRKGRVLSGLKYCYSKEKSVSYGEMHDTLLCQFSQQKKPNALMTKRVRTFNFPQFLLTQEMMNSKFIKQFYEAYLPHQNKNITKAQHVPSEASTDNHYLKRLYEVIRYMHSKPVVKYLNNDEISALPRFEYEHYKNTNKGIKEFCVICLVEFTTCAIIIPLRCRHIYHVDCVEHWLKKYAFCPLCKREC